MIVSRRAASQIAPNYLRTNAESAADCVVPLLVACARWPQDATFAVIAKRCGFDLWFVSAWLIILGVGVMQVLVQIVTLIRRVILCYRALVCFAS